MAATYYDLVNKIWNSSFGDGDKFPFDMSNSLRTSQITKSFLGTVVVRDLMLMSPDPSGAENGEFPAESRIHF